MKRYATLGITLLLMLALPATTFAAGQEEAVDSDGPMEVEAQIAHSPNPGGVAGAEAFAEYVESETDGNFTVNTVDYQALGSVREVTDQLRLGEMEFHAPGTVGLVGVWPELQMVNMPFLFTDREAFWALGTENEWVSYVREQVAEQSDDQIRYLGAAENSVRNLYTNETVRVPADMSGLKIRVQEAPIMQAVWSGLGAGEVVAMPGSERDAAVQQGTLDAIEGSFGGAWYGGNLSVLGHSTLTGHVYDYMHYMVSSEFYQSLSDEYQNVVDEAIEVAIEAHNEAAFESEQSAIEEARAEDIEINELSQDELAQWREQAIPVGEEFLQENVSDEFMELTRDVVDRLHEEQQ